MLTETSLGSQEAEIKKKPKKKSARIESKPVETEKQVELLDDNDRKVVEFALERLWDELDEMPDDALPKVFAYADTGARPLSYGVKPLMEAYYKSRGLPPPEHRFIASPQSSDIPQYLYEAREIMGSAKKGEDWKREWLLNESGLRNDRNYAKLSWKLEEDLSPSEEASVRGKLKQLEAQAIEKLESDPDIKEKLDGLEKMMGSLETVKARVQEVLESAPEKNVMIVDDYFLDGNTYDLYKTVLSDLERADPDLKWKFYTFFRNTAAHYDKPQRNKDPHLSWGAESDMAGEYYKGFKYRLARNESIGVSKEAGQAYVKRTAEVDTALMRKLRDAIAEIEEKVVVKKFKEKISKDRSRDAAS